MADLSPVRDWLTFSESLLELLDEIENYDSENDAGLHKFLLEQEICSLHLVLIPFRSIRSHHNSQGAERKKVHVYLPCRGAISFYVYIVALGPINIFLYVGRVQISCGLLPTRFC